MILKGDCIEAMKALKPNSVDAVVTDPPYGLEFMGKEWDKLGAKIESTAGATDSFAVERKGCLPFGGGGQRVVYGSNVKSMQLWHTQWLTEAYRVLKPGGSMLVMGGTRTFHRLMVAIEDTGFIIKDTLMWLYGSGFPKAQDLGKMIDKRMGKEQEVVGSKLGQPGYSLAPEKPGKHNVYNSANDGSMTNPEKECEITAPSTDLAKHWDGFKVGGIKPAYESVIWAYKPLTDIELFDIMVHKIKELLCLIQKSSTTKGEKTNGETETPCGINQPQIEEQVVLLEAMDMLLSEFIKRYKSLSIVSSWKNILEEALKDGNMSITKMVSCTITDLKILNSLLFQSIQENTPQSIVKDGKTDGKKLNASLVVDILTGVLAKLKGILDSSVQEPAISQEGEQDSHLKPNFSPIVWAVKPPEGSYIDNVLKWGVGAVNVDKTRISFKNNEDIGDPKRFEGLKPFPPEKGWNQNKLIQSDWDVSKGRFPANVILSHHPECEQVGMKRVKGSNPIGDKAIDKNHNCTIWGSKSDRKVTTQVDFDGYEQVESWDCHPDCAIRMLDEQSGDLKSGQPAGIKAGGQLNCYGVFAGGIPVTGIGDSGGASRFFYCAKASRGERNRGLNDSLIKGNFVKGKTAKKLVSSRPSGVLYNDNEQAFSQEEINSNNHPTVKPIALFEWLIKLVTREGQIVLDPFLGSGTTAIAAHKAGRECVGIEREDEYVEIAKRRIGHWESQPQQQELRA